MNRASREAGGDFIEVYEKLGAEMNRVATKLKAVERGKGGEVVPGTAVQAVLEYRIQSWR